MHILLIPSWYSSRRNPVHGSFFKEQALALSEAGYRVTVAYNEIWPLTLLGRIFERPGIHVAFEEGLKTYRYKNYNFLPKNPLMFHSFNKRMERLYKKIVEEEGRPDLIHAHSSLWAGISAEHISRKHNIPLVITEHSSLLRSKYIKESYIPYIKQAYNGAKVIITVGSGLKRELANYTDNTNIKVIPNMVDLKRFTCGERPNNKKVFSFFSLAFLDQGKGMDILIRAFADKFRKEAAELIIGGEGQIKEELIQLARELRVENQIHLLGALSRDQAAEQMKKCDAFVLASRHETFGVVYIEALACGKPVIGTRNGGAEDIINDLNGKLVPIEDAQALADAMCYVKDNYSKYDSRIIRANCIERFSGEKIIELLNKVYEEAL